MLGSLLYSLFSASLTPLSSKDALSFWLKVVKICKKKKRKRFKGKDIVNYCRKFRLVCLMCHNHYIRCKTCCLSFELKESERNEMKINSVIPLFERCLSRYGNLKCENPSFKLVFLKFFFMNFIYFIWQQDILSVKLIEIL